MHIFIGLKRGFIHNVLYANMLLPKYFPISKNIKIK
jgi:hypothetical protein